MIAVIDGCGTNIASIKFALQRLGHQATLTSDAKIIRAASHVILPGVGTAKNAMQALHKNKLLDVVVELTQPVLGICLGMQLMFDFSFEGKVQTLKIIPGEVVPFTASSKLTVPHMGWNKIMVADQTSALTENLASESYVYFVHSYYANVSNVTKAYTHYALDFSSIVQYKNFYGVQFHPERSGVVGEKILANFLKVKPSCNSIQQ